MHTLFKIIGLVILLSGTTVMAQPTQPTKARPLPKGLPKRSANSTGVQLAMKARNYGDSIVLRWNVNKGAYWLLANERGYILERITFMPNGKIPLRKRLSVAPIKPWSLDSMKKRLPRDDRYVAIAAQILHGKNPGNDPQTGAADFYRLHQQQQGQLLVAAMAAEFSPLAANALGLRWVDRSFNKSAIRCLYRLWINNGPTPKPNDLTDTVTVSVLPYQLDSLSAPRVARVESGDSTLKLIWYKNHNSGAYAGYYIERSQDGKKFTRLNQIPYVAAAPDTAALRQNKQINRLEVDYTDSVRVNYRKFYYRIIGINSFGDLSPVSKILVGSGRDLTPPRPPIDIQKKVEDNRRIILSWTLSSPSPDLKGFYIGQANDIAGPYQPLMKTLLPTSTRTYTNEKPVPYLGKYYVIAAVDTAGNVAYSSPVTAQIDDKTPPSAPKKLTVKVDTNGVATLRWPKNAEADVLGYKLYRSYQRDNEYYQQRTLDILADSMFVDTLPTKTLTRQAYYKLVAVDLSNNHSDFSEPLVVDIPDKIPPTTPIVKNATVQNNGILLTLIPSLSEDVTEHTLYRRESGGNWKAISKIPGHPTAELTYLDSTLVHQQSYEYSLQARDAGGRLSARSFVVAAQYVNLLKANALPPTDVQAVYNSQQKSIQLNWKSTAPAGSYKFMIYRGLNNESPVMYRSVEQTSFTDQNFSEAGTYTYAVQLITADRKSALSKPVQATYKP
ncbi:hypothetical protein GCM10028805_03520 [Spirosoma harenae]